MPDLIRHPEYIEITGFRLEFIPHLMRGRNDGKVHFLTFYECINLEPGTFEPMQLHLSFILFIWCYNLIANKE